MLGPMPAYGFYARNVHSCITLNCIADASMENTTQHLPRVEGDVLHHYVLIYPCRLKKPPSSG
jgi:hypothetical protein